MGVKLVTGEEFFTTKAVISAAGAKTTLKNILPKYYAEKTKWGKKIMALKNSMPYVCLNMGFKGDITEGGAGP